MEGKTIGVKHAETEHLEISHPVFMKFLRFCFLIFERKRNMQNIQLKTINRYNFINSFLFFAGLETKRDADIITSMREGDGCKSSHFHQGRCNL